MQQWFTRLFVALAFFSLSQNLAACGFNFVGDCPNSIFFNINNTPDSFYVGHCTFGTHYEALDLGVLKSLQLTKIKGTTWESCQNNVTAMSFFYRVYPTAGNPTGAFLEVAMPETYFTLEGPYTTRYRIKPLNVNVLSGLAIGTKYTMEVFFRAKVDTVGDDFIPEIDWLNDNSGQNYRLTFTPGGATAPPFTVVTTKDVDVKCAGDSTGIAQVNVYGDQTNLFYSWSNGSGNFFASFNLAAGSYTVTVSGAGGFSKTKTIEISAQSHLQNSMTNVQPVRCDGTPGQATAVASGGIEPVHYQWNTGIQQATSTFVKGGIFWMTVTDAIGCKKEDFVEIEENQPEQDHVAVSLCDGVPFQFGGLTFFPPGNFTVNLPGLNGGCDTLVELELKMLPAPSGTASGQYEVKCGSNFYEVKLTANSNVQGASYLWTAPNGWSASTATATFSTSDIFEIDSLKLFISNSLGCKKQVPITIAVLQNTAAPQVEMISLKANCNATWTGKISITKGAPPYTIKWDKPNVSGTDFTLAPGVYHLTVTGLNSCSVASTLVLEPLEELIFSVEPMNATAQNLANGSVEVKNLQGCTAGGCQFKWSNGASSQNLSNLLPGTYCLTATNSIGCTSTACAVVKATVGTDDFLKKSEPLVLFPNPTSGQLTVELSDNFLGKFFVKILDSRGAEVFSQSFENQKLRLVLDLDNLPVGVFQILIFDVEKSAFGRFVRH